jgi:acetaldehyde dehydrogenase (acetylating)
MSLPCAIVGSGNIGTDLMFKLQRSKLLDLQALVGIDPNSDGLARARELGIEASADGIDFVIANQHRIRLVFDATSAYVHVRNAPKLREAGIIAVDLTPAARGPKVVPTVNLGEHLDAMNVNMITCGGQATTPIVAAVSRDARAVRGDGVDGLVEVGRTGNPAKHRRVHPHHGSRTRGDRWRRLWEGHHHPQPGRSPDPDAQHRVCGAAGGQRP